MNDKKDEQQCLECGWAGQIEDCPCEKQWWSSCAGGGYAAVPLCPKCGSSHISGYSSQEAKEARLQFTGGERNEEQDG